MLSVITYLAIGLLLIWIASEALIEFSVHLSRSLKISTLVVGVVIVGFGTSIPELSVSALAARDDLNLSISNIVGSNIINLSLAMGIPILITGRLKLNSSSSKHLVFVSIASVGIFAIFIQGKFTIYEGVILLVLIVPALWILYRAGKLDTEENLEEEDDDDEVHEWMHRFVHFCIGGKAGSRFKKESITRTFIGILLGLAGTIGGAQVLVVGVKKLATEVGIETGFLGLTLVAIGTSMPEIIIGIQSARKKKLVLFVGNLLGSNVLHSLFVAGVAGIIGSGTITDGRFTTIIVPMMVGLAFLGGFFVLQKRKITRWQAIILLLVWGAIIGVSALSANA